MKNTKNLKRGMLFVSCTAFCLLPVVILATSEVRWHFASSHPDEARPATPHYHFVAGKELIYKINYVGTAQTDFRVLFEDKNQSANQTQSGPLGLAQSLKTSVQGQLSIAIVEVKDDKIVVAYSLHDASVKLIANEQDDDTDAETIKNDLGRNIFAVLNPQGKILLVRFDTTTGKLSQSFARALIATTQFVFPNDKSDKLSSWETQEEDPNGQYVAHYQPENSDSTQGRSDSITIQKTITWYLPAAANPSPTEFNVETTITPAGSLTATLDQTNGRVNALNGTESQTMEVSGKTVAHTQSTLDLNYVSVETLTLSKLAALRGANSQLESSVTATSLSAPTTKEDDEANIERTELANDNLETLLSDLAKLESASGDKDETHIYLKFKALIYLHPESSLVLGQVLAKADAKSLTMRVLTGALGAVGNSEAQAGLVTAIKARKTDWPALSMLIPALDESSTPTPDAEVTIRELASQSKNPDIASTAQLTLGAMARNLANTVPDRATKIVDLMVNQINSSTSPDTTRQVLLALGNAGSPHAYPTVARFTTDSSSELRAAATSALRFIDTDQAEGQLIKVLTSDSEPLVRLEAANALSFRRANASSFASQRQAFAKDKDDKVRLSLLNNLWKARRAFPEVRKLVEEAAAKDVSADVRKAASDFLAADNGGTINE